MKFQNKKRLIDVGEIGNAQTGDIIFNGGVKINEVFQDLYSVFGDRRLLKGNDGQNLMIIHGTGYYQKLPRSEYTTEIEIGQMHDISTSDGPLTIRLPTNCKAGERVRIQNFDGSWKNFTLQVDANSGGNIDGKQVQKYNQDFCEIQFVCTDDSQLNVRGWKALVTPLYGNHYVPIDDVIDLSRQQILQKEIFKTKDYTALKLLISGEEIINTAEQTYKQLMEVLVLTDKDQVLSTEYGVLYTSPEKLFTVEFVLSQDKSTVYAKIQQSSTKQLRIQIKSIEQIKI